MKKTFTKSHFYDPQDEEPEVTRALWIRYGNEKGALPVMPPEEYDKAVNLIAEMLGI